MPFALSWLVSLFALASAWNEPSCTTSRLPATAGALWAVGTGVFVTAAFSGSGVETGAGNRSTEAVSAFRNADCVITTGVADASCVVVSPSPECFGMAACRLADGVGSADSSDVVGGGSGTTWATAGLGDLIGTGKAATLGAGANGARDARAGTDAGVSASPGSFTVPAGWAAARAALTSAPRIAAVRPTSSRLRSNVK